MRGLSDAAGNLTDSYAYDAYGMVLNQTGATANPYLYRGEQYDADLSAYYQADTGRFLTTDPFQGVPTTPMSLHRYLYGNANPVNFIDPTGEIGLAEQIAVGTIGTIIGNVAINQLMGRCFKDVYVALGETFFPDAFIVGVSGSIPRDISDLIEAIFSAVPGAMGTLGIDTTGNVIGAYEGVFSTSSAEISLFGVLGGGANIGQYKGGQTHTRSLYWGYVWNLWNTDNYSGPFVSLGIGSVSFACSPNDFVFGPWGISRGAAITGYSGGSISTSWTNYTRLGNKPFGMEGEVHFFSIQILPWVQLAVQILQDRAISTTALIANFSLWFQTCDAKRFWNKAAGYTVEKRQGLSRGEYNEQAKSRNEPEFQAGPGILMFGQFL